MQYKTFKEYYWKRALLTLALPWGLGAGIFAALSDNNWSLTGILCKNTLFVFIGFILSGFLFAYFYGGSRWRGMKENEARLKAEEQEEKASQGQY